MNAPADPPDLNRWLAPACFEHADPRQARVDSALQPAERCLFRKATAPLPALCRQEGALLTIGNGWWPVGFDKEDARIAAVERLVL